MKKVVVFDLEGVLITKVSDPIIHPQAQEVLKKAREQCDSTYLWTLAGIDAAYMILEREQLLIFFDRIIGDTGSDREEARIEIQEGKPTKTEYLSWGTRPYKDLRKLEGTPEEYVLIEDIIKVSHEQREKLRRTTGSFLPEEIRNGYPPERVIYIESFRGQKYHSLMIPYKQALEKFTNTKAH